MKNKKILFVLLLLAIFFTNTSNVLAQKTTTSSDKSNKEETGNFGAEPSDAEKKKACGNALGITITAGDYQRTSGYVNGVYTNSVSARPITITTKKAGKWKILIYHGPVNSLSKLEDLSKKEIDEYNDENEEDEEKDVIRIKKKVFTNFKDKSWTWSLPAGEEALVVVLNNASKSSGEAYNGACAATDSKTGACVSWKKVEITCPKGKLSPGKSNSNGDGIDAEIKGNAAALFVENPTDTGFVENIRIASEAGNNACSLAYNGYYNDNGNASPNSQFTVARSDLEKWRNNYYSKILSYCNDNYVAFNLKESDIRSLSNKLLKVFYYNNKLDIAKQSGTIQTIETINVSITTLKNAIMLKYPDADEQAKHIFDETSSLQTSLSCRYKSSDIDTSTKRLSDEYLYMSNVNSVKTEKLSSGKKVEVCKTRCYEHLSVIYDTPQLLKAGLCFSYKVTVKSKSECGIDFNSDNYWKEITVPTMCSPIPVCSNKSSHTQAGPNEDFDNCVKKCDDGKYSQKCINKCYKQVYMRKTSQKTNTAKSTGTETTKKLQLNMLTYNNNGLNMEKMANIINGSQDNFDEEKLKNYNSEDAKDNPKCNTTSKIENNIDYCAEYFYYGKLIDPKGKYSPTGSGKHVNWIPNSNSTKGIVKTAIGEKGNHIPIQIARSSPFYLSSVERTKNLLLSLIGYYNNGIWYKYVINTNGVKRQYSARYVCNEVCEFYPGCSGSEAINPDKVGESISYTSSQFSSNTKSDLDKIQEALQKCDVTTACDTEEKTTTFEMKINVKRENNNSENPTQSGTTTLGETNGKNGLDVDGDENTDMFVAREDDQATSTGILGLCYDKRAEPHYQTTITYPGTYINYKHAKRLYTETNDETYFYKKNYFCTPYDSVDVNEKYWIWGQRDNFNPSLYPSDFSPEYNITASLGKTNTGFGKYNWKINFSCFYSIYNEIPIPIQTPTPTPDNPPKDSCNSEYSSKFCNTKFRIVTTDNLFPDKNGNKKSTSEIPYNWSSDAQDKVADASSNSQIKSYGINPEDYKDKLETATENNSEVSFSGNMAYHIYLTKENIQSLKEYVKQHGYTSFRGTYKAVSEKDGLFYYTMGTELTSKFATFDDSHANKGYNYSTHNYQ